MTSLTFDPEENHVILASKSGDVYQYPRDALEQDELVEADDAEESEEGLQDGGKLILGHISMVLDLVGIIF